MSNKTKGELILSEQVDNKLRRFGQAVDYFPIYVTSKDGKSVPALFTGSQIEVAIERARRNMEDVDPQDTGSFLFGIFG